MTAILDRPTRTELGPGDGADVVRSLVGPDYARVLPFSMLAGAALVVVADTVGRIVVPPSEVQVGVMAAAVGVPVFIALIRRTGRAL